MEYTLEPTLGLVEVPIYECPTDNACLLKNEFLDNELVENNPKLAYELFLKRQDIFRDNIDQLKDERNNLINRLWEIPREINFIESDMLKDRASVTEEMLQEALIMAKHNTNIHKENVKRRLNGK